MFAKSAEIVTSYFVKNQIISEDEKEIYNYGFEILLSSIFSITLALVIGIITKRIIDTLVYLTVFCTLRKEAGGFHASTHFRCIFSFISVFGMILYITSVMTAIKMLAFIPILFCCLLLFLRLAPVENSEVVFQSERRNKLKLKANILLVIYILLILLCLLFELVNARYVLMGIMAIIWESILLIMGVFQNILSERR